MHTQIMFFPFRSWLPAFVFLLTFNGLAAQKAEPRYQGLLWEITGKGIARPSYLYGTMHVPEKLAFNLSDSFFVALRGVDMVSLETDHDLWQDFMEQMKEDENTGIAYESGGEYGAESRNYLDLYGRSFRYEAPDSRVFGAMFTYKPMMTNEFLFRSNQGREDNEEDTYLDLFIFQAGRKLGKKVIGLESMEVSYESVMRSRIPDDKSDDEDAEPREYVPYYSIAEAYRRQDLSALDSLNRLMSPGKNFRKWMLAERNIVMADGIDSIAQLGKAMFSAVGAAHLPGDIGVIELLRQKGYHVRPVKFETDIERKDMADIENMRYPVTLKTQWAADSVWSADAPGKFYSTTDGMLLRQSLCADMSNGAYYAVYRIQTYGLWAGQSPEYISGRIDSLLYEKVPGRIQERKRINEPFPGHEITTLTRRGDIQRYKIFVTPLEVVMFMVGGNRSYASGEEGTRFINSIKLNAAKLSAKPAPTVLAPARGGFKVTFPAPLLTNTFDDEKSGRAFAASALPGSDSTYYFVTRVDYHDWDFIEEDTFELNIIGEKLGEQFGKAALKTRLVSNSPYPTQDFQFRSGRDSSSYYFGRVVIDGPHYYLLGCRRKSNVVPTEFFESFSITPPVWANGWEEITDTTMFFRVQVPKEQVKEPSQFFKNLQKIREEAIEKSRRSYSDSNEDFYDVPDHLIRVLEVPLLGEQVQVSSGPTKHREYPDVDSLQREVVRRFSDDKNLIVRDLSWKKQGDTLLVGQMLLRDTNSLRGIRAKIFVTSERDYTLFANVQLEGRESEFVNTVFNSFAPTDTSQGQPLEFGGRDLSFLNHIYDTDSLARGEALHDLRDFGLSQFKTVDFAALRQTIEQPKFHKLKFEDRDLLLSAVGATHAPEAVPYLQRFYYQYPDSARYQSATLEALARVQSKAAFKTMFELWHAEAHHFSSTYGVFAQFSDTLDLTRQFLPDILWLAENDEFSNNALAVVESLVRKGKIKPKHYASLKPLLLRQVGQYVAEQQYKKEEKNEMSEDTYRYRSYNSGNASTSYQTNRNMRLLMPFYKKDPVVRALFKRASLYGDERLRIQVYSLLLRAGQPVTADELHPFADDDKTRFSLYRELANSRQVGKYREWFSDTLALVRSYLVENQTGREPDSVRFLSRHKAVWSNEPAQLYFFEVKRKKEKKWDLAYVIMPLDFGVGQKQRTPAYPVADESGEEDDESMGVFSPYYNGGGYGGYNGYGGNGRVQVLSNLDTDKEKKEYIAKKVGEVRFANRRRYRSENNNYYGGGYNDF